MNYQPIVVNVKLESNDYVDFNTSNLKSKVFFGKSKFFIKGCLPYVLLFIILLSIFSWYVFQTPDEYAAGDVISSPNMFIMNLPTMCIFILFIVLISILRKKSLKKHFESNKLLHKETEYTFSEDGIKVKSESLVLYFKWEELFKVDELKNYFGFYDSNLTALIVPKRFFLDEESIAELRRIMTVKMTFGKYKIICE